MGGSAHRLGLGGQIQLKCASPQISGDTLAARYCPHSIGPQESRLTSLRHESVARRRTRGKRACRWKQCAGSYSAKRLGPHPLCCPGWPQRARVRRLRRSQPTGQPATQWKRRRLSFQRANSLPPPLRPSHSCCYHPSNPGEHELWICLNLSSSNFSARDVLRARYAFEDRNLHG